jgi:hypothetical protein
VLDRDGVGRVGAACFEAQQRAVGPGQRGEFGMRCKDEARFEILLREVVGNGR